MPEETRFEISVDVDIISASKRIRQTCRDLGLSNAETLRILTAAAEIARNIIVYAKQGEMTVSEVSTDGKVGLLITARDRGPGIPDLALAMTDGYSTGNTLGFGLPGAKRLMDEFSIESKVGEGTEIRMIKWKKTD
ncbi:MAG: anti-sigma regulatory factor [Candidatus Obscuribacterales bacterium]|nr:anti-sigma regulatory factor [Candidatus Obscuribacterales bacterium]